MIIRSNKEKWVTADTCWVKDSTLSAKARGILIYLLSLPDDWNLHINELVTHFTDGKDSIRTGIKELTKHGYLFCIPRKDETGKFIGNDYVIMEDPRSELPHTDNGHAVNPPLLSTNKKLSTNINTLVDLIAKYKTPIKILNDLTGRNFKLDNRTVLSNIKARVRDGSPIEEICEVIRFICKQRMGTKFEMFLRPSTVFNRTKYENYLEEYKHVTKDLTNEEKCAILSTGTFLDKAGTLRDLE